MARRRNRALLLASAGNLLGKTLFTDPLETFSRIPFDIPLQFYVLGVSLESPLRRTHSLLWSTRTNEGIPREGSFHALAVSGKIFLVGPAKFGDDGRSVILEDGRLVPAAAVVLATGYESTLRSMLVCGAAETCQGTHGQR